VAPGCESAPAAQLTHAVAPEVAPYLPALHVVHAELLAAAA
jgi:hypothetical protein